VAARATDKEVGVSGRAKSASEEDDIVKGKPGKGPLEGKGESEARE
jgi:hypothetical protein